MTELTERKVDPQTLGPLTLAYLGDGVYEVFIRQHLVESGIARPNQLQRKATHYVSAKAQAKLMTEMQAQKLLTETEQAVFKRGRNAKSYTHAKNTPVGTYKISTGFEAVFGYLALKKETQRLSELASWCIRQVEQEETDHDA